LQIRDATGRDCAMIHYLLAWRRVGTGKRGDQEWAGDGYDVPSVRNLIREGWPKDDTWFRETLERMRPFFEEIERAASIDEATFTPAGGTLAIEPAYLYAQTHAANWMTLRGYRSESRGDRSAALDDYLIALKIGRDLCTTGSLAYENGIAIQTDTLTTLNRLINAGVLENKDLLRLMNRLAWIEIHQANYVQLRGLIARGNIDFLGKTKEAKWRTFLAQLRMTRLAVAIAQYGREMGHRPVSLDALVPQYLRERLSDPFTDQPFVYQPRENEKNFMLYSLGADGVDQGGTPVPALDPVSSGDVLWEGIP
jgi:hypothetical protein